MAPNSRIVTVVDCFYLPHSFARYTTHACIIQWSIAFICPIVCTLYNPCMHNTVVDCFYLPHSLHAYTTHACIIRVLIPLPKKKKSGNSVSYHVTLTNSSYPSNSEENLFSLFIKTINFFATSKSRGIFHYCNDVIRGHLHIM